MQLRGSGFVVLGIWWFIAVVAAVGLFVMAFADIRLGGRIMSGAFLLGALIRLVRSPRKAGGLTIRARWIDVTILLLLATGLLYAAETVKLDAATGTIVRLAR